ncbi:MAG: hypothetical protein QM802_18605 [Agriterribacter sp.]
MRLFITGSNTGVSIAMLSNLLDYLFPDIFTDRKITSGSSAAR